MIGWGIGVFVNPIGNDRVCSARSGIVRQVFTILIGSDLANYRSMTDRIGRFGLIVNGSEMVRKFIRFISRSIWIGYISSRTKADHFFFFFSFFFADRGLDREPIGYV